MPAILVLFFILLLIILVVSMVIPAIGTFFCTVVIGRAAKLDEIDKISLAGAFYLSTGFIYALTMMAIEGVSSIWGVIGYLIFGIILWPIPYSFLLMGVADQSDWPLALGILISSFVVNQLIAIIMILKKVDKETDLL